MRRLLVLGGGTAGTMVVNKLRHRLPRDAWQITVVDQDALHPYQPGFVFVPFGVYSPDEVVKPRRRFIPEGVDLILSEVDWVDPETCSVRLVDGRMLPYDYLVIATGAAPRPERLPGLLGPRWRESIFDFYTLHGATALARALEEFPGGRLVMHIADMPVKFPLATLEFAFLADAYFRARGMRDRVELVYATPLPGALTRSAGSSRLGSMLDERKVAQETGFLAQRVDTDRKALVSYDEREIPFDLLVTVPVNMGADFVGGSGLGDDLNYVTVDRHTLRSTRYENVFALGDASDAPTTKAGSAAHFAVQVFAHNFLDLVAGRQMSRSFDGHADCFVESGDGRGLLIDSNYDTEPLAGTYPVPGVGPFPLLKESRVNHWGKLAFRWMYWNVLLPGRPMPLPVHMPMAGKRPSGQVEAKTRS